MGTHQRCNPLLRVNLGKSLPQPWEEAWSHLVGILMSQLLEGLDSRGLWALGGDIPTACGLLALWGEGFQLREARNRALYSV